MGNLSVYNYGCKVLGMPYIIYPAPTFVNLLETHAQANTNRKFNTCTVQNTELQNKSEDFVLNEWNCVLTVLNVLLDLKCVLMGWLDLNISA